MTTQYWAEHDGLQWALKKEADGKDGKRVMSMVGYFPRYHQVMSKMYELLVAEKVTYLNGVNLADSVQVALGIYENLKNLKGGERVSA